MRSGGNGAVQAVFLVSLMMLAGAGVRADSLVADLSAHLVKITSQFRGADLLLFGAIQDKELGAAVAAGKADIIVVIRGPGEAVIVRRKQRTAGIWVNRSSVTFTNVPGYYAVAATRPVSQVAPASLLKRHGIGLDYLALSAAAGSDAASVAAFRAALLRNKKRVKLYPEQENGVALLGGSLFRTDLHFPANVPVGTYRAEVYLLRRGRILYAQSSPLFIDKTGIEREVYNFAHHRPALYGVTAVALAVFAGWLAATVFRKD